MGNVFDYQNRLRFQWYVFIVFSDNGIQLVFHVVIGRRRGCSSASTADEEKYTSADASGKVVFLCGHYRMDLL